MTSGRKEKRKLKLGGARRKGKEMEEKRKDMDRRKENGEEKGKLRNVKKKARGE